MSNVRSKTKDSVLKLALKLGLYEIGRLYPGTLTVLNYHRIENPNESNFSTFKPNISASPEMFDLQMEYLARHYNIVSANEVTAWITDGRSLPPKAALVTFDDGYLDNYSNAYPVLHRRGIPAIIFLASDYMESSTPFYWDLIAHCFISTRLDHVTIPKAGFLSWKDEASRDQVVRQVVERMKTLPESEKQGIVDAVPDLLNVSVSNDHFRGIFLTWENIREMAASGIEMGAHTASHPILTRISLDLAKSEIVNSKKRIEEELNRRVTSFAYPNGQRSDFSDSVIDAVKSSDLQAAYTLLPGPTRLNTVKRFPYQIRRIYLSHKDSFPIFAGKLAGVTRII